MSCPPPIPPAAHSSVKVVYLLLEVTAPPTALLGYEPPWYFCSREVSNPAFPQPSLALCGCWHSPWTGLPLLSLRKGWSILCRSGSEKWGRHQSREEVTCGNATFPTLFTDLFGFTFSFFKCLCRGVHPWLF